MLEILRNCPRLREVDFRDSGKIMRDQALIISGKTANWEIPWAVKGSRKACAATLPAALASDSVVEVSRERNTGAISDFDQEADVTKGAMSSENAREGGF